MAAAEVADSIECGFCYLKDKDLQDPRVLPCSHIFCRGCLAGQLEELKVIRCPPCRQVFDVVVDNLPTYKRNVPKHKCDVCTKKGKGDQPAVMYCNSCTKKYCEKHQEYHEEMMVDHVTMTISEYVGQADRLETRHCTEHKEQPYGLGCGICLNVFCVSCISPLNVCTGGKGHQLMNLGDLVTRLTGDIDKLRGDMTCRKEQLSALFKKTSKEVSHYEEETKELLEKLYETRDRQIHALQAKYNKLEEELIRTRKQTRMEMMLFMEEKIGKNLNTLANQRMRIEARLRNNHQVDIVTTYRDTKAEARRLVDGKLPELSLDIVHGLRVTGEKRDIDAEIVPVGGIYVCWEPALSAKPPPKSATLLNCIKIASFCHAVCYYKGRTYLGTQAGEILTIEDNFSLKTIKILEKNSWAYGISAHQDTLYALISGISKSYDISVCDLNGKPLRQWTRKDKSHYTRPAIVLNQIIIPDRKGKQLGVYSLTGQWVKNIACPELSNNGSAACAVDENSVIVTSYNNSLVFRVDITSGQTVWSCKVVVNPQATAMFGKDLVCIASEEKITFLNINTGERVSELAVGNIHNSDHFLDIDVYDNMLVVSSDTGSSSNWVSFYRLVE